MKQKDLLNAVRAKLQEMGFSSPPVDPLAIAARCGIQVSYKDFKIDDFGGLLIKGQEVALLVLNTRTPARWAFTTMHELVHYWFHPPGVYCESGNGAGWMEVQANKGAAEALMPAEWVAREAPACDYRADLLAHEFGVSRQAMVIRLEELGLDVRAQQRQGGTGIDRQTVRTRTRVRSGGRTGYVHGGRSSLG